MPARRRALRGFRVNVDALAIAAHPDDVEMCCAGTLAKLKAAGRSFGVLDLTRGEMGTRGDSEVRDAEARRAAEILGASFRKSLDFGDGGLRTGRSEEDALIDAIRRYRPRIIFTSYPEDRHPDHVRAGQIVADAAFYAGLRKRETAHPAHRPQQVLFFSTMYYHTPSFVVDVSATYHLRRDAILAFSSQFHNPGSSEPETMLSAEKFLKEIEARARHYGQMTGVEFGEGFISKRPVRIDDPLAAFEGYEPGF
jgi:bacillithiol biosynthesis deacetylase BshB1